MKITRSTKCTLRFATAEKRATLRGVLAEYGRVCQLFIDRFWSEPAKKTELLAPVVNSVGTWLSARLRKVAAREAIDMVGAARKSAAALGNPPAKPRHSGRRMCLSSTIADLLPAKSAKSFDCWLHLASIGANTILDLPVRLHRHFKKLAAAGRRLASYVVTDTYVQFAFEIETGRKLEPDRCVGIDTGINALTKRRLVFFERSS